MRVPIDWLADYVKVGLPTSELAEKMTMAGLKIEAVERMSDSWADVVIGHVVELSPHPHSNKPLHVAKVSVGSTETTIVTGAQNVSQGDRVPVVLVGGFVPFGPDGQPMEIIPRPMAGITSNGMLASARELGISDEHEGIYILPDEAPVGEPLRALMGGDVLDIETVSNRPDTLSMVGIAREVAAITEQPLSCPDPERLSGNIEWLDEDSVEVNVYDANLCPRYSALRVQGVTVTASPFWLIERLSAAGQRPINLLVDLTNYVMLELGQPMHAFDARQLVSGKIGVRRAGPDESLRTLDGVERLLPPGALLITDGDRPTAVAGVMGGEESEIGTGTSALILEAANFDPTSVRKTAQALGLRTEASSRFEKGQPPEQTVSALLRYVQLLSEITGSSLQVARVTDVWPAQPETRSVTMPWRDLDRLVGTPIPREQAIEALTRLGFEVRADDTGAVVKVPYWRRVDIQQSADLVEEVARMVGFDRLPATLPRRTMPPPPLPCRLALDEVVQETLLGYGANEVTTHSLTSVASLSRLLPDSPTALPSGLFSALPKLVPNPDGVSVQGATLAPVVLLNPATSDRQVLRMSLLPSLLEVVARNLKHTSEGMGFFEIDGTYFTRGENLPYERHTLGIALCGMHRPRTWAQSAPSVYTFYDLKGMLEGVCRALQVLVNFESGDCPALHPGRSAVMTTVEGPVAHFGELHPRVLNAFDCDPGPVLVGEVDLDALYRSFRDTRSFHSIPRYPAALRDLALVVAETVPAHEVLQEIRGKAGERLESAQIFDVYVGDPLPAGQISLGIELVFRAQTATLTQQEVSSVMDHIVESVGARFGAVLRQ